MALVPRLSKISIVAAWEMNGTFVAGNGADGLRYVKNAATISDVYLTRLTAGSSGTTDVDIKISTAGGAFVSIFTTRPTISSTSGNNAYRSLLNGSTNTTAPVFSSISIPANSLIRCDLLSAEGGTPEGLSVELIINNV